MKKLGVIVGLVGVAIVGISTPALASPTDVSSSMTIDHSTFTSGELNPQSVTITFPLVTLPTPDRFYIDLPEGFVFTASDQIGLTPQPYDPATGMCGSVDTGVTIPLLTSTPYTCSTGGAAFPFEFVIQGAVPSQNYVIHLAANSFRAMTTTTDVIDSIKISVAFSTPPPLTIDDFGYISVTTLGKLANTGIDTFAIVAAGGLTVLCGVAVLAFAAFRRRAKT
jgi:hypothetical protein